MNIRCGKCNRSISDEDFLNVDFQCPCSKCIETQDNKEKLSFTEEEFVQALSHIGFMFQSISRKIREELGDKLKDEFNEKGDYSNENSRN